MILKLVGAICIAIACVGACITIVAYHRREVATLKSIIFALEFMLSELEYRMPPLSDLCRKTAYQCDKNLQKVFLNLSNELENQISPDAKHCMDSVLSKTSHISEDSKYCLFLLGESLGRFDLQGQLRALESVKKECTEKLNRILDHGDVRIRSWKTLGLCTGAALIILLI